MSTGTSSATAKVLEYAASVSPTTPSRARRRPRATASPRVDGAPAPAAAPDPRHAEHAVGGDERRALGVGASSAAPALRIGMAVAPQRAESSARHEGCVAEAIEQHALPAPRERAQHREVAM